MKMGTGGVTGGTHCGNNVALVYVLTLLYIKLAAMSIKSLDSVAVVNDDVFSVTSGSVYNFNNGTCGGSVDIGTVSGTGDIHTGMAFISHKSAAYISAGFVGGPDEAFACSGGVSYGINRVLCSDNHFTCNGFFGNFRCKNLAGNGNTVFVSYKRCNKLFALNACFGDF